MKLFAWLFALTLLLMGCATSSETREMKALYEKFSTHCEDYARHVAGEADMEHHYKECMHYFTRGDFDCPYCVITLDQEKKE
jgi:hypothetical protein